MAAFTAFFVALQACRQPPPPKKARALAGGKPTG